MDWVYLDNNATTQPDERVVAAMLDASQNLWANPSSVHRLGQLARQRVELARASIARLIGAKDRELVFTSGGTEANNLALRGTLTQGNKPAGTLITTDIEHAAIREPATELAASGVTVIKLPTDIAGLIDVHCVTTALHQALRNNSPGPILVSVLWANNETGVIQDIAAIARACKDAEQSPHNTARSRVLLHIDATQAVGKIPVDLRTIAADLLTLAPHKFHGPKGVGVLFVRIGVKLKPLNRGGAQERDRRGGTENTPAILGAGVAADLVADFLSDTARIESLRTMRDRLERGILSALPELRVVVNSGSLAPNQRLWNTTNIGFAHLQAEAILLALSERGLCASAGAACSSGSLEPSPVLLAMGIDEPLAHGSVRFSLSRFTTDHDIDHAIALVPEVVLRLARAMPGLIHTPEVSSPSPRDKTAASAD
jgi:cysteine desulfurase